MDSTQKNTISAIHNEDAETALRPLTAMEVCEIDGGGIIDAAREVIRLLRSAGQPQL